MTVDIRRGTCSRVSCSTGHCDKRYAGCDLHGDVGMPQGMHRSMRQVYLNLACFLLGGFMTFDKSFDEVGIHD